MDSDVEGLEDYEEEGNYDHVGEKCLICGEGYRSAVVTRCEHVFCEKCALGEYKERKECFQCGKDTLGTFNDGGALLKRALEEKEVMRKRKKERKANKKQDFGSVQYYLQDVRVGEGGRGKKAVQDAETDGAVVVQENELRNWV